jgi:antitoxin component YwqK of YwqJK toxin-antitoxin module
MTSVNNFVRCNAITKTGVQCTRNAVKDGLCTQHYKIYNSEQSQALPADILKYTVSDYLQYDDIKKTEGNIPNLQINNGRIEVKENKFKDSNNNEVYNIDTYVDGRLHKIVQYKNNKKYLEQNFDSFGELNGIQRSYYLNGNRKEKSVYKNGILIDVEKKWYENGVLRYEAHYINGLLYGILRTWYSNGLLFGKYNYSKNVLHGKQTILHPNKTLYVQYNYINGVMNGVQQVLYENGQMEHEWNYNMGKMMSESHWNENGSQDENRYTPYPLRVYDSYSVPEEHLIELELQHY